ncbi:MAG: response regulator, partial [Bacteroidetes bacterium]|nr:response regulator [Bacteroidota bacterium]
LVLLDVMMPGMDGFETCRRLKQLPGGEDIPVIFLTAKSDTDSLVEGFQSGGIDYLAKPFQAEELMVRVKTHLEMKQMRAKLKDVNKWLQTEVSNKTIEITEANQQLKDALLKVESLDKSKDNFLKIISHEIRTPLNGIIGASFLLKSMAVSPEQKEFFEMLDISLKRLESFSYAALQITQLQASGNFFPKQHVDVHEIVEEANKIALADQQRRFFLESEDIPPLNVNKDLFVTALIKLLDNAIRYSPADSLITLKVHKQANGLHFKLTDEGPGFSPEVLLRKFELFVTGETHVDKNPGLSLPLVKFIIEAHGGRIDLSNNPSGGAVVEFYIPDNSL